MSPARRRASDISRAVGDVVFGRYKRLRMSQADLVELTGISTTTMRRLVAGEAEFDVDQLHTIAGTLGASAADILWEAEIALSDAAATKGVIPLQHRKESGTRPAGRGAEVSYAATADPELDTDTADPDAIS